MQKTILSCVVTMISVAITSTTSVMSVDAQPMGEYIDSTSPQVIEKISDTIVTFKDVRGESRNYYVPAWMFSEYNLKVGSAVNLYNRNVIQGIYRNTYIDVVSQSLSNNVDAFRIHDTRRDCTISESPASEGLASGKRVWYKSVCCPSTIPVVGAMWFYQRKEIVAVERSNPQIIPPTSAPSVPAIINQKNPVQGLW